MRTLVAAARRFDADDYRRLVREEKRDLIAELVPLQRRVAEIHERLKQLDEAEVLLEGWP